MAEFNEVMKQYNRLCNAYDSCHDPYAKGCRKCPMEIATNDDHIVCDEFLRYNPKEAEKVIMDWAAAHPESKRPTRREVFTLVFPNAMNIQTVCPRDINCQFKCPDVICPKCKDDYWDSKAEGGFGGFKMTEDERSNTDE